MTSKIIVASIFLSNTVRHCCTAECHMWGYNPQNYSASFARSNICIPTLKIMVPLLPCAPIKLITTAYLDF